MAKSKSKTVTKDSFLMNCVYFVVGLYSYTKDGFVYIYSVFYDIFFRIPDYVSVLGVLLGIFRATIIFWLICALQVGANETVNFPWVHWKETWNAFEDNYLFLAWPINVFLFGYFIVSIYVTFQFAHNSPAPTSVVRKLTSSGSGYSEIDDTTEYINGLLGQKSYNGRVSFLSSLFGGKL